MTKEAFYTFVQNHWILWSALVALVAMLTATELKIRLAGVRSIKPQEAVGLINQHEAVVLDIRDTERFKSGHIVDAVNIPASEIKKRESELAKYKDKYVIVACASGQHGFGIGSSLRKQGFNNVHMLRGGMASWQSENLPLVK